MLRSSTATTHAEPPVLTRLPALVALRRDVGDTDRIAAWQQNADLIATALESAVRLERALPVDPTAVLLIAEQLEEVNAYYLAFSMLAAMDAALPMRDTLTRGRTIARMARVSWKAGDLLGAAARYERVLRLGQRYRLPELRVRAWIGQSVLAHLRGEYAALKRYASKAARLADKEGLSSLSALAHHSLMVGAAAAKDFSRALIHGWRAYESVTGDVDQEAERLLNLSQVLADTGRHDVAVMGFRSALALRPPLRLGLPALGGLASSAAVMGDVRVVRQAADAVEAMAAGSPLPYQEAAAWTEIASALRMCGDDKTSARARARAKKLADAHGYHELSKRLDASVPSLRRPRLVAEPQRAIPIPLSRDANLVVLAMASMGKGPITGGLWAAL